MTPRNRILLALCLALLGWGTLARVRAAGAPAEPVATAAQGAFVGRIAERTHAVVDPGDGTQLVLTGLTLRGTALASVVGDGPPPADEELVVWFPGGVVSEDLGSFVADAPARHETREGRWIVALHRRSDALGTLEDGTRLAGQVLEGGRAGLFTAFVATGGDLIVQGRPGTLVGRNVPVGALRSMIPAGPR